MKKLFSVIFMNFFGFDMIIFLVAVATALVFYFTKKSADVLYNKLHLNIFVPDSGASRRQADSDISGIRETDIVSMRNRTGSLYSLFVNLTGIFPLLGILGTVISLLGMVGDMTNVQDNFYGALTSTFWGLVFAIIFKFLDGIISAKIEDNEKNVQLYLERNNAEHSKAVNSQNGFRKNKGIVIELTSLLDVIMIMLFWVMTDVSASADSQKEDAKAQMQAVTQQLEEQKQKSADELEKLREDMQKQIDEAYKKAESINSNAAKNQQALDGYTQGMLISLDMRNENGTDKLYISRNDEDIMTVTPDEDISGRLISLFEGLGAADGEVMLAAVVYDGDAVLYRNMRIVENAVQAVSDKYENVYFTYINTSK